MFLRASFTFSVIAVSTIAMAGVEAGGQIDKPTARSLFSTGYGVTFDAEAPMSVDATTLDDQSLAVDAKLDTLQMQVDANTDPEVTSPQPDELEYSKASNEQEVASDDQNKVQQSVVSDSSDEVAYAGLSYQLYKQGPHRQFALASPDQVFLSGDRVYLEVTSNIAGTLVTGNIDSNYDATLLSIDDVVPGKVTRVPARGALKFVGVKGTEKLVFVLTEDTTSNISAASAAKFVKQCQTGSRTRSLVVDDDVGNQFQLLESDGSCAAKKAGGRTRSIIVDVEEDTGYGVIEDEVLKSGKLLSLIINLEHQ